MLREELLPLSQESILSPEQKDIIKNTTLIIPDNDGEAHLTIDIARKLGMDVHVSSQAWGARLDKELELDEDVLDDAHEQIWVFEMPSQKLEEKLMMQGVDIDILDHHQYRGNNRSQELSSLEQFLRKLSVTDEQLEQLGFSARFVKGVAISDRAYIYGLRKAGYSEDEIRQIREYDIRAQLADRYDDMKQRNEEIYNSRRQDGNVTIIHTQQGDISSMAVDRIVMEGVVGDVPTIVDVRYGEDNIQMITLAGEYDKVVDIAQNCHATFGGSTSVRKTSNFAGWIVPTAEQIKNITRQLGVESLGK